jgi:hypothetical protein
MVHPDAAIRALMREVGAVVRPLGFRGSVRAWTSTGPNGVAVLSRTVVKNWQGPDVRRVTIGLGVTPTPWFEYHSWRREHHGRPALAVERAGTVPILLLENERLPGEPLSGYFWVIRPDPSTAPSLSAIPGDVDDVRVQLLPAVRHRARRALELLEPGRYLDELRALPEKSSCHWEPIAVLLAERGPSPELDDALDALRETHAGRPAAREFVDTVTRYVRMRAARAAVR